MVIIISLDEPAAGLTWGGKIHHRERIPVTDVVLAVVGVAAVALGVANMLQTLLHSSPRGVSVDWCSRGSGGSRTKATGRRLGSAVRPAAMVTVIGLRVVLQVVVWALIY